MPRVERVARTPMLALGNVITEVFQFTNTHLQVATKLLPKDLKHPGWETCSTFENLMHTFNNSVTSLAYLKMDKSIYILHSLHACWMFLFSRFTAVNGISSVHEAGAGGCMLRFLFMVLFHVSITVYSNLSWWLDCGIFEYAYFCCMICVIMLNTIFKNMLDCPPDNCPPVHSWNYCYMYS